MLTSKQTDSGATFAPLPEMIDQARSAVSTHDLLALTQALVRIPSENPPGLTKLACLAVAEALEPSGFDIEYLESSPGVVNVVARYVFPTPGRTLLLNGHLDVVPVGESETNWSRDPWSGELVDGRLYGRGSLDMKGPLAALLVAAKTVVKAGLPLTGEIVIAAVADEEQGGNLGAGVLVNVGKIKADGALVAEPGDGGVVIAHRDFCHIKLTTRGRAAHASMPSAGANAVEAMMDALAACQELKLHHEPHPLLGGPSIAVGTTISGGTKTNVIPDECHATLDVRTVPGMTPATVVEAIRSYLRSYLVSRTGVEPPALEVTASCDPAETSAGEAIVQVAAAAFEREFHVEPRLQGMPASTDARWFVNAAGIPTVAGLAPGSIGECHVVDESIDFDELIRYARIYVDVIVRFLGRH